MVNQALMPTINDYLSKIGRSSLFTRFGMDPKGNNEVGAWVRAIAQGLGYNTANRTSFLTGLEDQRQAAINDAIAQASPENMYANANEAKARLLANAGEEGAANASLLRTYGLGQGAQAGAALQARNNAIRQGNDYLTYLGSPEGRDSMTRSRLNAIGYAENTGLDPLLNAGSFIEARHARNSAEKAAGGMGGLMGTIGQFAGMIPGASNYLPLLGGDRSASLAFANSSKPRAPGTF